MIQCAFIDVDLMHCECEATHLKNRKYPVCAKHKGTSYTTSMKHRSQAMARRASERKMQLFGEAFAAAEEEFESALYKWEYWDGGSVNPKLPDGLY